MSKWSDPEEWSRLLTEQSCKGRMRLDLILLHPRTADRPYIAAGQEDREPVRSIGTAMNRLMEKAGILFRMLSRAAGVVGCVQGNLPETQRQGGQTRRAVYRYRHRTILANIPSAGPSGLPLHSD